MKRQRWFSASLFVVILTLVSVSTLFVSSAKKDSGPTRIPGELDVRVVGATLRGGLVQGDAGGETAAGLPERRTLRASRSADNGQMKALRSLEQQVGSKLTVEYNQLSGTPRHMLAQSGYLTPQSPRAPEHIAGDFIRRWQGLFRFSEADLAGLRLKSRATVSDTGTTILLFEQQLHGVPVYKGAIP